MPVDGIGLQRQGRDIVIAPQPALEVRRQIAAGMDLDFFGADHAPAALGLEAAHGRQRARHAMAEAVAVRHLVEAIGRGHRPDADRLEETS
jgi:hypothetical protein